MRILSILIVFLVNSSCTKNFFDEFARKDTKEAIFFDAKLKLNKSNYSSAITSFDSLATTHPGYYASEEMLPLHASAYAGRCGLDFISLLETMQSSSSTSIFGTLMGSFPSAVAVTSYTDCLAAEDLLETIGDASARSGDENLLIAFESFAKIGVILSSRIDIDGDGVANAGVDVCDPTDFPTAEVREVGTGISIGLLSLAAVGTSYVDDSLADVNALCALDPQLAAFCNTTDPSTFTPLQLGTLRKALGSTDFGTGSCGDTFANCLVTPPLPSPIAPGCGF